MNLCKAWNAKLEAACFFAVLNPKYTSSVNDIRVFLILPMIEVSFKRENQGCRNNFAPGQTHS